MGKGNTSLTSEKCVFVEGGTFHNGVSNITLSSYLIDKYPVTNQDLKEFGRYYGSNFQDRLKNIGIKDDVDLFPAENIWWLEAIRICNDRSIKEGLNPCYSYAHWGTKPDNWPEYWCGSNVGWPEVFDCLDKYERNVLCDWTANGYRLPTEMEWEFAARGGNKSEGFIYSGSNEAQKVAWSSSDCCVSPKQVGTRLPNELDIYDMSGNVWEWCWDIFDKYPLNDITNPKGPIYGKNRVLRGGNWSQIPDFCTVSYRYTMVNFCDLLNGVIGFRCVKIPN